MGRIHYTIATSEKELLQILELQKANLKEQLTQEEIKSEGFVTVSHSLEQLRVMNQKCPHILAREDGKVVGYALCMHADFSKEIEILKPMFREIEKVLPAKDPYLIMGQVCIDKAYRKQGIFRGLYNKMLGHYRSEFTQIITEVDERNQRSLSAHYAIGFDLLSTYNSNDRLWHLIAISTK